MEVRLLPSPWEPSLREALRSCSRSLFLCLPRIDSYAVALLSQELPKGVRVRLLTRFDLSDARERPALLDSLESLLSSGPVTIRVRALQWLNARTFVFDEAQAIVTSANFTEGGLAKDFEVGLLVRDDGIVAQLLDTLERLWAAAQPIGAEEMQAARRYVASEGREPLPFHVPDLRWLWQFAPSPDDELDGMDGERLGALVKSTLFRHMAPGSYPDKRYREGLERRSARWTKEQCVGFLKLYQNAMRFGPAVGCKTRMKDGLELYVGDPGRGRFGYIGLRVGSRLGGKVKLWFYGNPEDAEKRYTIEEGVLTGECPPRERDLQYALKLLKASHQAISRKNRAPSTIDPPKREGRYASSPSTGED